MGSLVYPRLPSAIAYSLIVERAHFDLGELEILSSLTHPDAEPSPTGGHPARSDKIAEIRERIRLIATEAGYPNPLGSYTQDFDRPCGTALLDTMDIVPADAADDGVWSFLSLVVVPEIGPWRFPKRKEVRLLGRPRNVLRRTWWRAWALGPDLVQSPEGCTPLGEDESVQIMERSSLGGNRRTAQALQAALWRAELNGLPVARSEVVRELTRSLRATKSHIAIDALADAVFDELLDRLLSEAVRRIVEKTSSSTLGSDGGRP